MPDPAGATVRAFRPGAGVVELNVTASNERALDLYRRAGFEPTVEWPHHAVPVHS